MKHSISLALCRSPVTLLLLSVLMLFVPFFIHSHGTYHYDILIVHERLPLFDSRGSDLRLLVLLQELRHQGHSVFLVGRLPSPEVHNYHEAVLKELDIEYQTLKATDPSSILPVLHHHHFDHAVLFLWFWNWPQLGTVVDDFAPLLMRYSPDTSIAILSDDSHWRREAMIAQFRNDSKALERAELLRWKETKNYKVADIVLAISEEDEALFQQDAPGIVTGVLHYTVKLSSMLHHLPPFSEREGIAFLGSANLINQVSLERFIHETWPLIHQKLPSIRFHIIGHVRTPTKWKIRNDLLIHGHVQDLTKLLSRIRLCVAPMVAGTGINTKNLAAFMHGVPVVATRFVSPPRLLFMIFLA